MDVTYWTGYLDLVKMKQDQITITAELKAVQSNTNSSLPWQSSTSSRVMKKFEDEFNSWTQLSQVIKAHANTLAERMKSERESWVRLFTTSKVGLGLHGRAGRRDNTAQTRMTTKRKGKATDEEEDKYE